MKKVLYNQLVDQYAAYNLQYEEKCKINACIA